MSLAADAEGVARMIYEGAGYAYGATPVAPSELAERHLGAGAVRLVAQPELARLERRGSRWVILVSTRAREPEWLIGHELAHWASRTMHGAGDDQAEALCDLVGACLLMPPAAFRRAIGEIGDDFDALAERFGTSPTAVALRYGEVTGEGVVVVAPSRVAARGEVAITHEEARRLAWRGGPGIAVVRLGRKRVALRSG